MKAVPVRPFHSEILLDEGRAIVVNGFCEICRFALGLSARPKPPDSLIEGSVHKHMIGITPVLEIVGGTAPDDDAIAAFRSLFHHVLGNLSDAIGIRHLEPRSVQASFVAAA